MFLSLKFKQKIFLNSKLNPIRFFCSTTSQKSNFKLKKFNAHIFSEHLSERVFRMNRFYKQHEKDITPTAVKFCQMKWHESCGETLKRLGMSLLYQKSIVYPKFERCIF